MMTPHVPHSTGAHADTGSGAMAQHHEFGTHHLSSVRQSRKSAGKSSVSWLLDNSVGSMQRNSQQHSACRHSPFTVTCAAGVTSANHTAMPLSAEGSQSGGVAGAPVPLGPRRHLDAQTAGHPSRDQQACPKKATPQCAAGRSPDKTPRPPLEHHAMPPSLACACLKAVAHHPPTESFNTWTGTKEEVAAAAAAAGMHSGTPC